MVEYSRLFIIKQKLLIFQRYHVLFLKFLQPPSDSASIIVLEAFCDLVKDDSRVE